ncbi:PspA/IM30 family protein [Faecalibaculum rodentium]|uniref:PspA/IM30 family protein n=1 Tax=Faecalibaculum rodentium TaxID=1702221 RepID=UPI00266EB69D|nr:PspA/IM30 family protein [Faecalibaculum rodentium]
MGILSRFSEIMKSNINALLDRAEDPEKMADQMLRNTREQFAEVKAQTASVMADAAKANRDAADCQADIARYQKAAENALISRNEGDAKKLITQKQKLEEKYKALQQAADLANANADKMRQMYDKLASDIETLEARKDAIKAKTAAAKAQQSINRLVSGLPDTNSSLEAFDRMDARATKQLDAAMAEAQLNETSSSEDLAEKYSGSGSDVSVDSELEEMKKKLGL